MRITTPGSSFHRATAMAQRQYPMARSWTVLLLPYIEQDAMYKQIDLARTQLDTTVNASGVSNRSVIEKNLNLVLCPSDPSSATPRGRTDDASGITLGLTNYSGSVGDHRNGSGTGTQLADGGWYDYGNSADNAAKTRGVITRYGYGRNSPRSPMARATPSLSERLFLRSATGRIGAIKALPQRPTRSTTATRNFKAVHWDPVTRPTASRSAVTTRAARISSLAMGLSACLPTIWTLPFIARWLPVPAVKLPARRTNAA